MGLEKLTLPHADIRFRRVFDNEYSLPRSHLLRIAVPRVVQIELRATSLDDLGPDFERLPDDQAEAVCNKIDEIREGQGKPPKGLRHVYMHFALGPQVVYHQPFKRSDPRDPQNSAEVDETVQVDINLVFRDDDDRGFEFTATLQGSANFFVLDPNRDNPDITDPNELARSDHAQQGQLQLQLAYYFRSFTVLDTKLSLSLLIQAAGAATYQYDPTQKKAALSWSAAGAAGVGLDVELSDDTSLGFQITAGPNSAGTADFTASAVIKGQFDLGPKPKPKPKKK
jgi:hypothetical protein